MFLNVNPGTCQKSNNPSSVYVSSDDGTMLKDNMEYIWYKEKKKKKHRYLGLNGVLYFNIINMSNLIESKLCITLMKNINF